MMAPNHQEPQKPLPGKFLRLLGILWVSLVGLLLLGNALAPHLGRCTDVMLQYVWHWDWTVLTLDAEQRFFDLSTPESAIKSYYSALYRGDATHMAFLTQGSFAEQMRQRVQTGATVSGQPPTTYRSYVTIRSQTATDAEVIEKFHLFWQQGLRFSLRRATTWHIVALEALSEE